jgi:hypothetical protein
MSQWLRNVGVAMWLLPTAAFAQFTPCHFVPTPYIASTPAQPFAGEPFTITVAEFNFIPEGIAYSVNGNVVDVTLTGGFSPFLPPGTTCSTVTLGPLPAGDYTIKFNITTTIPPATTLRAMLALSVATDPSAVPSLSVPLIVLTSLLVLALGSGMLSFRRAP